MTKTKYTDLEKGETEQLTTKEIKESNKIEVCWWCMLICPIIIAITFCTCMVFVIINQYKQYVMRNSSFLQNNGGEGGIRTHGTLTRTSVFETDLIDHSSTSPSIFLFKIKLL